MINKKKVLGRGLGALMGEAQRPLERNVRGSGDRHGEKYMLCPVMDISPNKTQPRKTFEDSALRELSESIRQKGVLEPLLVRKTSDGLELIAGERRWRAAKLAGLTEVPVVITDATDEESLEIAIIENIQREDLNAIEEAEAYNSLVNFGLSQEEVAKRVGKERATVANYLRLLKLPQEIKEELVKNAISMGHARALLSIEGHAAQRELCKKIIQKGLSVRQAEELAKEGVRESARPDTKAKNKLFSPVEDELRGIFGTKIVLKERHGKGSIEIKYFSSEERERIIDLIRSIP